VASTLPDETHEGANAHPVQVLVCLEREKGVHSACNGDAKVRLNHRHVTDFQSECAETAEQRLCKPEAGYRLNFGRYPSS